MTVLQDIKLNLSTSIAVIFSSAELGHWNSCMKLFHWHHVPSMGTLIFGGFCNIICCTYLVSLEVAEVVFNSLTVLAANCRCQSEFWNWFCILFHQDTQGFYNSVHVQLATGKTSMAGYCIWLLMQMLMNLLSKSTIVMVIKNHNW